MTEQILLFIMFQCATIIVAVPTIMSIKEQFQGYQTSISDNIPITIFLPLTIFFQYFAIAMLLAE